MPDMDYSKLLGRMREKHFTQQDLADSLHLSRQSMSNKLNGKTGFSADDIIQLSKLLDIKGKEVGAYFFTEAVAKTQQ